LTTRLARRYGTVVVEDLDVAAMQRSMGRRAFHRTVSRAGVGRIRPTLAYKARRWAAVWSSLTEWFGSSKSHHGCGGYRADLKLGDRLWSCPRCERLVDRNANAALNLRDWTGPVDIGKADADGDVQRGGVAAPVPHVAAQAGDLRRAGSRRALTSTYGPGNGILGAWFRSWLSRSSWLRWPSWR
jgi:transposase